MLILHLVLPHGATRAFPVNQPHVTLGRREDCTFRVPLPEVSREHCRLHTDYLDGSVHLKDLGSANGTCVNFKRVREAVLSPGDVISVGPARFIVAIGERPDGDAIAQKARRLSGPRLAEPELSDSVADEGPIDLSQDSALNALGSAVASGASRSDR